MIIIMFFLLTRSWRVREKRWVGIWEAGSLSSIKIMSLDQSAGVIMPFWSDNNILFLGMCFALLNFA